MKRLLLLVAIALALAASGCSTGHPAAAPGPAHAAPATAAGTAERHPLPALEPRLAVRPDVPWHRVGRDWHLVMTVSGPRRPDGVVPRQARIQLLGPAGRRTDVVVMDRGVLAGAMPGRWSSWVPTVEDVSPVDHTVLLRFTADRHATTAVALDLRTGRQRRAPVPPTAGRLVLLEEGFAYLGGGGRLVSVDWDGTTAPVGGTDGTVLPLPGRVAVVTGHPLRVLGVDGTRRRLAGPPGVGGCGPRRWWGSGSLVVTCSDHSLWQVPVHGGPPVAVTQEPDPHGAVMDFGAEDAVRVGGEIFVQKSAGCGAGWLARADPDGTTTNIDGTRSQRLVGVLRDRLLVQRFAPCGRATGLVLLDPATLVASPLLDLGPHGQLDALASWDGVPDPVR